MAAAARPVWVGNLSFGLVSLPVGLHTATDSHTVRFHRLQRGTSDRIRNRRVNERTGTEVQLDEIAPGRSRSLDITGFFDPAEVDPIFFDRTYYLGPRGAEYGKVYSLRYGRSSCRAFRPSGQGCRAGSSPLPGRT